jgi:predicted GIY-YIG superfamily endonuclease
LTRKYRQLSEHLAALAESGRESAEFGFADISALVDGLPPSAYENRQWWANSSLTQAQAWRDADWHVEYVSFDRQRVRFARGKVGGSYQARGRRPASETAAAVLVTETDSAELDVRVRMTWQRAGHVTLGPAGDLVFPELPRSPGIYRLTFTDAPNQDRPRVYVGESEDVRNRARQHHRPGSTQQTSLRIPAELVGHLRAGGTVTMAVATEATVCAWDEADTLPLGRKSARVLAEHAALALTYLDDDAVIIDRDSEVDPGS